MLDFCIIGTPKSGTTSLFNWLSAHPAVQGASPKETHFLMDADHPLCGAHKLDLRTDGAAAYAQFFPSPRNGRRRFEATPHYFYQHTARDYLTSLRPQPIIIAVLREPGDRILSSFRFTRDNLGYCDSRLTFNHFVQCLLDDATAELDSFFRAEDSLYIAKRELQLSRYCEWLNWWLERLERKRLEVIGFDKLANEPEAVMKRLCEKLDIDPDFYDETSFTRDNPTYPVGKHLVHRVVRPLGACLPAGRIKEHIKQRYLAWQCAKAGSDSDYQDGMMALRDYFKPWNERLAEQFEVDIEGWTGQDA